MVKYQKYKFRCIEYWVEERTTRGRGAALVILGFCLCSGGLPLPSLPCPWSALVCQASGQGDPRESWSCMIPHLFQKFPCAGLLQQMVCNCESIWLEASLLFLEIIRGVFSFGLLPWRCETMVRWFVQDVLRNIGKNHPATVYTTLLRCCSRWGWGALGGEALDHAPDATSQPMAASLKWPWHEIFGNWDQSPYNWLSTYCSSHEISQFWVKAIRIQQYGKQTTF